MACPLGDQASAADLILAISAIPANGSLMLQNDTKLSVKKNKIAINLWYN
ncbi:MAG: hypothetical protein RI963_1604, partial [Planctomycetota bacterium]